VRSQILRCPTCQDYTLAAACPECGAETLSPLPPRYSPEDHYGKYRRALLRMQRETGSDEPSQPSPSNNPPKQEAR